MTSRLTGWIIRTPTGEYRARVQFFAPRMGPDEEKESQSVWFFASCDLCNLHPEAVAAALELRAETSGIPQFYESWRIDRQAAEQLARDLDLAVRSGQIRFERIFESAPPPVTEYEPFEPFADPRARGKDAGSMRYFARFVDERGQPIEGFRAKFDHSPDPERDVSFSGVTFAQIRDVVGSSSAWLKLPDDAVKSIVDELKRRWNANRGRRDDSWKAKEQRLLEVLFNGDKLPLLSLEAQVKHTFMIEPHVMLARLHGLYFGKNKCFLLPTASSSLRRLIRVYEANPDSEVLIVGHTDMTGDEKYNQVLSGERAEAMRAYLTDDVDAWLAWYQGDKVAEKRWGEFEDTSMIECLVPEDDLAQGIPVAAYQRWHNSDSGSDTRDARLPDQPRPRADGWEELKVDGKMGPNTRRQLILDYMSLDGTSLKEGTRVITYGCGEYFPLETIAGEASPPSQDEQDRQENRRTEVFFFAKPFGILPKVPGVPDGESSDHPVLSVLGGRADRLYPEWMRRAKQTHLIGVREEPLRLRLCDYNLVPYVNRPFALCLDGYPEVRGTTDKDGYAILDAPPSGARGYVKVWPDDEVRNDEVRWEITVAPVISTKTPLGASTRLANLDYYSGAPTPEMTDELRDAICYFQYDTEGLDVTGELDQQTCAKLKHLHDGG